MEKKIKIDELKTKVLNFVKKQNVEVLELSSPDGINLGEDGEAEDDEVKLESSGWPTGAPATEEEIVEDEEILKNIDENYFKNEEDFDIQHYQLKKLPEALDCDYIKRILKVLYRQHGVVSKKMLQNILEKESQCKIELQKISHLTNDIETALEVCREGRQHLNSTKQHFTTASLGILANYKRKQIIHQLLTNLKMIKTLLSKYQIMGGLYEPFLTATLLSALQQMQLVCRIFICLRKTSGIKYRINFILSRVIAILSHQRTDEMLQELLLEENYPGAINLLLECQIVASNFNHFKCVAQLNWKLQDTLCMTEEQLDIALSKICRKFNLTLYTKLQEAYALLEKTQTVMDQLLMHFTSEIHSVMFNIVYTFVGAERGAKKQYKQLCQLVPMTQFIPCLQSLCQNLWHILSSYHQVVQWHQSREKKQLKTGVPSKDVEMSLNKQYVKQKLENGLKRLWNDVQSRISTFLTAHDFADYKFEELLLLLGLVHRLIEVGEEFCGSKSLELEDSVRQLTVKYFKNYHSSKLEELRIFLENESWTQCPVRSRFNLIHLQEFKTVRSSIEYHRGQIPNGRKLNLSPEKSETDQQNSSGASKDGSSCHNFNYFVKFQDGEETPFDSNLDESFEEDVLNSDQLPEYLTDTSEDSENEELKKEFVEDNPSADTGTKREKGSEKRKSKESCPIVANTTLTVLRLCGKYLQMCRLLKPIALDVILCMCQLFDYYIYNVYNFFAKDLPVQSTSMMSFKLQTTLQRLEELMGNESTAESWDNKNKIVPSKISEQVNLWDRDTLFGLSQRIVGVESLVFLGSQFEYIQPYVMHLIPEEKKHLIQHFYLQTVSCVSGVRRPAYMCVSGRVIDMQQVLKEMSKVNFEVKDVMSQHSPYIDRIVRDLQIFSMKLESVDLDIPIEAYNVLWENVVHIVNNALVEGFSNVKKCSNGGRALMQLDYTQFKCKLEKLTSLKPIPNKEFVDSYVKAFYLEENNLEEWIKQHDREYTTKQLEALILCTSQCSKKTKQRLLQSLENGR